jgi:hypothetical protein
MKRTAVRPVAKSWMQKPSGSEIGAIGVEQDGGESVPGFAGVGVGVGAGADVPPAQSNATFAAPPTSTNSTLTSWSSPTTPGGKERAAVVDEQRAVEPGTHAVVDVRGERVVTSREREPPGVPD